MRLLLAFALSSFFISAPAWADEPTAEEAGKETSAPDPAPTVAPSASVCTYTDLHEKFTIRADCEGLKNFSGHSQDHKRIWLAGDWGQLQVFEVPEPYRTVELSEVMDSLGRRWSKARSPEAGTATLDGAGPALYVTERKLRTTSCSWVFAFGGRNLVARAVSFGERGAREAKLKQIRQAFETTFAPQ